MTMIRHGIVGMGGICKDHIEGLAKLSGVKLTAICDANPDVLQAQGNKLGICQDMCFADFKEMLESPEVDTVSICSPNFLHADMVSQAIAAGKPFAIEKPLSLQMEQSQQLLRAVEQTQLPHLLCFSYRFMPAARYARWIIKSGLLGEVRHVLVQYLQGWGNDLQRPLAWRFRKELAGSGALGDLGSHVIDLTRFLVGEIDEVTAATGIFVAERPMPDGNGQGQVTVDDYAQFLAKLQCGAAASYTITRFAYGRRNLQRVEIYGSQGGLIYYQDLVNGKLTDRLETCIGAVDFKSNSYHITPVPQEFCLGQMEAFVRIARGEPNTLGATIYDGYRCDCVMDAVLHSAKSRHWEKVCTD